MSCVAIALPVGLGVALVRVDVAALPVPVGPLRAAAAGMPVSAQERPQPRGRRRVREQVDPQRPGGARGRDSTTSSPRSKRTPWPSVSIHAAQPRERDHPRHRRVVALRDAADVEHVRRAVRPRVGAVGAELQRPPRLVDVQPVARAEPDEALLGMAGEHQPDPVDARRAPPRSRSSGTRDTRSTARLGPSIGIVERLLRDHALGQLDELILRRFLPTSNLHRGAASTARPRARADVHRTITLRCGLVTKAPASRSRFSVS